MTRQRLSDGELEAVKYPYHMSINHVTYPEPPGFHALLGVITRDYDKNMLRVLCDCDHHC